MKLIVIVVLAVVAVALAAPAAEQAPVQILRSDFEQEPNGQFNFAYETSDGTAHDETGEVKQVPDEDNKPQDVIVVRGSYSYVDPEGKSHSVTYYADETGFHAESEDIPKA